MNSKSRMQIKAKENNTYQNFATLMLLAFCILIFLLVSNINLILNIISDNFSFAKFMANKYFRLVASIVVFLVTIPILARLKAIREVWFILKTKSVQKVKYSFVRATLKKIGVLKITFLYLEIWARKLFWFCLFVSPTYFMFYYWRNSVLEANATKMITFLLAVGVFFLLLNSLSAYLCIKQKYSLCYWLIIQRQDLSVRQVIKQSAVFMDKKCIDLFIYKMRFVAWCLLCVIFIPAILYVYPYYKHACAVYAFQFLSYRNKFQDHTVTFERIK